MPISFKVYPFILGSITIKSYALTSIFVVCKYSQVKLAFSKLH
jgi:hypothetical protein